MMQDWQFWFLWILGLMLLASFLYGFISRITDHLRGTVSRGEGKHQ